MLACFLFLLVAAFYFHQLLLNKVVFIERDLSVFFIPPRYLWVELVTSFQMPLWNPFNYSGIPLLGVLQPAVLYPPHIFYLFLPFNVVWNWMIILHFPFAALTTYCLLRYMKVSKTASLAGGITFMLSGYLISIHSLLSHLLSVPWFPLVILFFLKFMETQKIRHILLASIFLTMEFFAGAPEIVIMNLLVLTIMIPFIESFIGQVPAPMSLRLKGLIYVVLFFSLLSAVQLIPFYELKMLSIRRTGLTYREATIWSFSWQDFLQFFIRDPFGNFATEEKYWRNQSWLKTLYLGFIPFFLSAFYFLRGEKRQILFVLLIVLSFVFALGGNTWLYQYLYRIPPFNAMRYPVKYLFVFFFVISMTVGLGLDSLRRGMETKDRKVRGLIHWFFYGGFIFALAWGFISVFGTEVHSFFDRIGFKPDTYNDISTNIHNIKRVLFFTFLFCIALTCYMRTKRKPLVLAAIVSLLGCDLFLANYHFYRSVSWESFMSKPRFTATLQNEGAGGGRYFVTPKAKAAFGGYPVDQNTMSSSYAALLGLYSIDGCEVFRIERHESLVELMGAQASLRDAKRYLNVLGVRFIITPYQVDDADFRLWDRMKATKEKDAYIYEYTPFSNRFVFYGEAHFLPDDKQVMQSLSDPKTDLKKDLFISYTGKTGSVDYGAVMGEVKPVSLKANKLVLDTVTDNDGFLYCSDTWYPGWRAYVDGKRTEIFRANLAFRAVFLPKGNHRVEFVYVPLSFYGGLGITVFGLLLCGFLVRREWKQEKDSRNKE
jgi:hypothetical protein